MPSETLLQDPEFKAALVAHERQERINTGKVAAALVVILMPVGSSLDFFVYPDKVPFFLALRLACSVLAGLIWYALATSCGQRHYRVLGGLPIALLPALFICWMIYDKEGSDSPYYAGLNLILLAVSVVVHWSIRESVVAVASVMLMYLVACSLHGTKEDGSHFTSNLIFMAETGVIVVTGNFLFNRLRFREFTLRYQLDQNRKQLQQTNEKLVELDQIKSRFFANVSHELRTPLTLLIAPLENLVNRFGRSFDDETRQLLDTMHANGMRLLKLINDLLDLVRLESGVMLVNREEVDLAEFLRGLASAVRQIADDKRIRLETQVAPEVGRVMVDRDKLEKIILNLQFNAVKFTPAGGRVEVRARRQENQLVIEVQDTGMGISAKNLANVFSRFWQADDSSRRKYQGMGIGLALVKELTEVQEGTASVQSQEGKGTTFTVRLPYLKAETSASAPPESHKVEPIPSASTPKRGTVSDTEWLAKLYRRAELFPAMTAVHDALKPVETSGNGNLPKALIADDEPDMLRFLKSQLQSHYQVIEAVDGQQAVDKASQFLPDIILLDMMMPEKDGLQACREIRERTPTRSIPVVLITARADEETKLAALSAGASDFLPKPFSTTELHVRVKNLVESHHYQNRLSRQNQVLENTLEQLKETQTQLVQSEKLASLGRMSAGIIHEINNPLNFATTGLYTLRNKAPLIPAGERSDYSEILHDVEEGISRVRTIVSDLRSFTHPDMAQVDEVPVREVVTPALRFTSNQWRDKVSIEQSLPEGQIIRINRNKLLQVLVNLLQNSLDALRTKAFQEGEQPTIWIRGEVIDGWSRLTVRDNGHGISPEHLDKIFDPFFTTKDVGEGMGLGLSICHNIVQEYGGQIRVRSEPGQFCEFTLEFPIKALSSPPG